MALLEQGKVQRSDTTINLVNWQAAPTSGTVGTPVDRILHNSNQIVRATLTQPKPDFSVAAWIAEEDIEDPTPVLNLTDIPELVDGINSDIDLNFDYIRYLSVGFTNTPTPITTDKIFVYTKYPFSASSLAKLKIHTSYINVEGEPNDTGFSLVSGTVTWSYTFDNINDVYIYTATFSTPQKFNYLRLYKYVTSPTASGTEFLSERVVEITPYTKRVPTMKYWFLGSQVETNGAEGAAKELPENTLDIAYNLDNDYYYALVFKETGGTSVVFDDDFSEGGSAKGDFSSRRWEADRDSIFSRTNEQVVFDTNDASFGKLTSRFTMTGPFESLLYYESPLVVSSGTQGYLRVLDEDENVIASVGVSYSEAVSSGTYHSLYATNFKNFTNGGTLKRLVLDQNNTSSQTWKITYSGSNKWTVSGTVEGRLASQATTGQAYSSPYFSLFIGSSETHSPGESFEFDVVKDTVYRTSASGTLSVVRDGNTLAITATDDEGLISIGADSLSPFDVPAKLQIYAETAESTPGELIFDNFEANPIGGGYGEYPGVPSLQIQRIDSEGQSAGADLVTTLDVINDADKDYNYYLNGTAAIAASDTYVYLKAEDKLMKFGVAESWATSDGTTGGSGHATAASDGHIPVRDVTSLSVITMNVDANGEDVGPSDVLVYQYTNVNTSQIEIRTITVNDLHSDSNNRILIVDNSQLISTNRNFFWNINDKNTMYFVEDDTSLYYYNTDDRLVGFVNVNFADPNLPAGIGATTEVSVTVANLWGSPLAGKTVSLAVTAGDGSISPSSVLTDSTGTANDPSVPLFVAGSTTGTTTVKATVNQ
jgi:hypothetical protein